MRICKESEIITELTGFAGCRYFVYYIDREITGGVLPEAIEDIDKVTELRAFDKTKEIWLHRDSLEKDFYCRVIDDSTKSADSYFDETQLLDIDTTCEAVEKDGKTTFTAMGGGQYTLPVSSDANAVVIRNYLRFNEKTGRAEAYDFRVVDFVNTEIEEVRK